MWLLVEVQIVNGIELGAQYFVALVQVVQVGPAEVLCRCSSRTPRLPAGCWCLWRALRSFNWPREVNRFPLRALRVGITQSNMSTPAAHALEQVRRRAHAHQVAGPVAGISGPADRPAPSASPPWARRPTGRRPRSRRNRSPPGLPGTSLTQRRVHTPLHDAEQGRIAAVAVGRPAARRPAQ